MRGQEEALAVRQRGRWRRPPRAWRHRACRAPRKRDARRSWVTRRADLRSRCWRGPRRAIAAPLLGDRRQHIRRERSHHLGRCLLALRELGSRVCLLQGQRGVRYGIVGTGRGVAPPRGFEPLISTLKGWRPRPLDDGGQRPVECTRRSPGSHHTRMKAKIEAAARHPAAASAKSPPMAAPTSDPRVRPQRASFRARDRNQALSLIHI